MKSRKRRDAKIALVLLLLAISLGYAVLTTTLNINGTTRVTSANWDIHFANLNVAPGSVALSDGDVAAAINSNDTTKVSFTITLDKPGDYYEFTVDVVNAGTIDGMITNVESKIDGNVITSSNLPSYLEYVVTYSDGSEIRPNQQLNKSQTETYKVRVAFKTDISASDLPGSAKSFVFDFNVTYQQKGNGATSARPFATDDWATIVDTVQNGDPSIYTVGDTKTIDLGNELGVHTVRVANNSTPEQCETTGFSQTACGFVLEFTDIITMQHMHNSTDTNVGGWRDSDMRTYVNSTIYNNLPSDLKAGVIDTTVVSSHGSSDSSNFTTTDKLYLLSTREIWGNVSTLITTDTVDNTRQLDYYNKKGVVVDGTVIKNQSKVVKLYSGNGSWWSLRTAASDSATGFFFATADGHFGQTGDTQTRGVSPAFRIG